MVGGDIWAKKGHQGRQDIQRETQLVNLKKGSAAEKEVRFTTP